MKRSVLFFLLLVRLPLACAQEWESFRSRLFPQERPITRQDFGWSDTRHAGGEPGEIGGRVQRSLTPARYGWILPQPLSLENRLEASGVLAVTEAQSGSGALIGWFHDSSRGWRTPNSVAFRVDGNGDQFWVFYEYGTRTRRTGGGGAFEGDRYQTTPTPPFRSDGQPHRWHLLYDPTADNGQGRLSFQIDDRQYHVTLSEEDRADGASLNRCGIWCQEATGNAITFWLDNLVVNGVPLNFSDDPHWEALGNRTEFAETFIRPFHNYGGHPPFDPNGQPKTIGGVIWRDEQPSYYARSIQQKNLGDSLRARGTIRFVQAGVDSGVYIGWFNSQSKTYHLTPETKMRQRNYLGVLLEGPSRVGHYFRPGYGTRTGRGDNAAEGPLLHPDGKVRHWSINYSPDNATITVTLDDHIQTMPVAKEALAEGAHFDRFGLFNLQSGGWHVEVYLSDLHVE